MTYPEAYREVMRVWLALRADQGKPRNDPALDDDLEGGFPELLDLLWNRMSDEERNNWTAAT